MRITTTDALASNPLFNHDDGAVRRFVATSGCYSVSHIGDAVERLHDSIRDDIDYNVFDTLLDTSLTASEVITEAAGFCLHKSVLFVAGCRSLGVPAVLCSDVVRNHVSDQAMRELVGGEQFLHWYAKVYLHGRWIKAAPIFNALLCSIYGIDLLRFNPHGDAVEQPFVNGSKMIFAGEQRTHINPTMESILQLVKAHHPRMVTEHGRTPTARELTHA